ncbi:unnamed protein product [Protopolystoma xenopodis]|uniref:Uncharacterized protein n=1 Tax=Protopolystoma xenopodis TaxID=117903 RepID=A0A3S5CGF2_9PLAT|nr:unnamed protein product [Protopolystoma xenopodis]
MLHLKSASKATNLRVLPLAQAQPPNPALLVSLLQWLPYLVNTLIEPRRDVLANVALLQPLLRWLQLRLPLLWLV